MSNPLPVFTENAACTLRVHCKTCRAKTPGGDQFRAGLTRAFTFDPAAPCPHGVPWEGETTPAEPAKMRGLGDVVAKVTKAVGIKECGGCAKRRAALNKLLPFKGGSPDAGPQPAPHPPSSSPNPAP